MEVSLVREVNDCSPFYGKVRTSTRKRKGKRMKRIAQRNCRLPARLSTSHPTLVKMFSVSQFGPHCDFEGNLFLFVYYHFFSFVSRRSWVLMNFPPGEKYEVRVIVLPFSIYVVS